MTKEFEELSLELQDHIYKNAEDEMSVAYKKQKESRDNLLAKIALTIITYKVVEDKLDIGKIERGKLSRSLNSTISDIVYSEGKFEESLIYNIMKDSAINKNGIDSYVLSVGLKTEFNKLSTKDIDSIVSQTVEGKLWSERLWSNKDKLKGTLTKEVSDLLKGRTTVNEIDRVVRDRFNQNAYNSKRLITNEIARVQDAVNDKFAEEHQVVKQRFMATLDDRTSSVCQEHDGLAYSVDDPSKPSLPLHVNCRSVYVNIVDGWEPSVRKDNITKEYGSWSKYEDWLSSQS